MPTAPPAPVQPPAPPLNVARLLNGNWMATYPGGPLRVVIGLDQMLRGRNYVATLVDGNKNIPPGQVVWKGTVDPNVPGIVIADQICAEHGFLQARWVKARILVRDASYFPRRTRESHRLPRLSGEVHPRRTCSDRPVTD